MNTLPALAGVHDDLDEAIYHAHPALSASGAKKLLPPSCPAHYKWQRDNGQPPKREFDFGHAAHAKVLGVGAEIVTVDADSWRTKAAKEAADAARAEGKVPLLAEEVERVDGMADALRRHPIASALLDPDRGRPEVSLFWHDQTHGVDRRARLDWLPEPTSGRLIVADYKSAQSAEPGAVGRAAASYGYHMQAAWYLDAVDALELAEEAAFVFVFQEKTPPYIVTVAELDAPALEVGRRRNDLAMQVFAECTATGEWPAYTSDVELITLPRWAYFKDLT